MKRVIYLFLLFSVFCIFSSCKNTPIDKVLDNKEENPENFKSKILSLNDHEKSTSIQKETVKSGPRSQETATHLNEISTLYAQKKESPDSSDYGKPFYSYFEGKQKDFGDVNHVSMSYNAAPIEEIIPVFAKVLDFNFYLDPNVKGAITMTIDSNLSKRELWMVFEQVLLFIGAYCSIDNGIVHIQPLSLMSQERRLGPGFGYEANVSVVLFRLNNAKSSTLVQQLKPFMTNGAVLIDVAEQNSVLIVEAPSNIQKVKAIVGMLDVSTRVTWPKAVIRCINVPPTRIADELVKILPVLGLPVQDISIPDSGAAKKELTPGAINIQGVDRLQMLIVSAANSEVIEEIKKWVDVLDRNDVGDQYQVYVYNVLRGRAEELIQTLSVIFNVKGSILNPPAGTQSGASAGPSAGGFSGGGGGGSSPSPSPSPRASLATAYDVTQVGQGAGSNDQQQQDDPKNPKKIPVSAFDVQSNIMADAINQRLIIKAVPRTYSIMKALLERIDTTPTQVLLSVTVADISLTNITTVGVQTMFINGDSSGGTDYGITDFKGGAGWILKTGNANIALQALAKVTKVTTLANPQILVQNNMLASISIGDQTSVITGQVNPNQGSGSTSGVTNTYTFKDTGIIIKMTPQITKGGLVCINYNQNISSVSSPGDPTKNVNPSFSQKYLQTQMIVPDGGTIIIGGLIQNKVNDSTNSIPFINNIPFAEFFTGKTSVENDRVELLVLISANIINKTNSLEEMSVRYVNAVKLIMEGNTSDIKQNSRVMDRGYDGINKLYLK